MRADLYLLEHGYAESRQKAKNLIEGANAYLDGNPIKKASQEIDETMEHTVEIRGQVCPYVSRGGWKLEAALDAFDLRVDGMLAVDFGASTGGFTDCLLQRGARRVIAVDSGSSQLHPKLLADDRVCSMEGCNARYLTLDAIGGEKADIAVCDLSFISQSKIYDAVCSVLKEGGIFVSLIKPQFEAGREHLNKNGICKNEKIHEKVKQQLVLLAKAKGLLCQKIIDSPITGGDGNKEYLALFMRETTKNEKGAQ